jgi:hypothetical protein
VGFLPKNAEISPLRVLWHLRLPAEALHNRNMDQADVFRTLVDGRNC